MDNIKVGTLVIHGKSLGVVSNIINDFSYQIEWSNGFREWVGETRIKLMHEQLMRELNNH